MVFAIVKNNSQRYMTSPRLGNVWKPVAVGKLKGADTLDQAGPVSHLEEGALRSPTLETIEMFIFRKHGVRT